MNCKQGELAVIVSAVIKNNIGKIVKVVRPCVANEVFVSKTGEPIRFTGKVSQTWVVHCEGGLAWADEDGAFCEYFIDRPFYDACLRPLRDNPGQDETLQWAPVPKKVEA